MPAAYAHMVFGGEVYRKLPFSVQSAIDAHRSLFGIGLQGPDILFYYHPSAIQAYVLYGHNIHKRPAVEFFRYALNQLDEMKGEEKEKGTAYLMGFLCHFILDNSCHPIVRRNTIPGEASHREIEREFDRFLMEKDKIRSEWYFPWTRTVPMVGKDSGVIGRFYPEADAGVIKRGIRNMRIYETGTTWYRMRSRLELSHISGQLEERMKTSLEEAAEILSQLPDHSADLFWTALDCNFG